MKAYYWQLVSDGDGNEHYELERSDVDIDDLPWADGEEDADIPTYDEDHGGPTWRDEIEDQAMRDELRQAQEGRR